MKFFKSHFDYSRSQRNGIFVLIALIFILQATIYVYKFKRSEKTVDPVLLSVQEQLDSLSVSKSNYVIKPFNPNYISDYKAYQLGMSVAEIDRLLLFRKQDKYVNSTKEFGQVTKVSDSLLKTLAPYFKFPKWVSRVKNKKVKNKILQVQDINKATVVDLMKVTGIGNKRAGTIVKYRKLLQGFSYNHQIDEVWGIPPEILMELKKEFKVLSKPKIYKINVNTAKASDLAKVIYINYKQAKSIIAYRKEVAEIQNLAELKTISDFPVDNFDLISIYLQAH